MPVPNAKQIQKMKIELSDLEAEIQDAQQKLPALALDAELGNQTQHEALEKQKDKNHQVRHRIENLKEVISEADRRFTLAKQAIQQKNCTEAAERASKLCNERIQVAAKIDNALTTLETAFQDYTSLRIKLVAELRLAGLDSKGEIARRMAVKTGQFIRWAAWNNAPNACEALEVPYARGDRRQPMEAFETKHTPDPIQLLNSQGDRK